MGKYVSNVFGHQPESWVVIPSIQSKRGTSVIHILCKKTVFNVLPSSNKINTQIQTKLSIFYSRFDFPIFNIRKLHCGTFLSSSRVFAN